MNFNTSALKFILKPHCLAEAQRRPCVERRPHVERRKRLSTGHLGEVTSGRFAEKLKMSISHHKVEFPKSQKQKGVLVSLVQ